MQPEAPGAAAAALHALEQRNANCTACPLRAGCRQVVVAEGKAGASLVIVGEGPGAEEDRAGRPFVGPSGALLDRILEAAGLHREDSYLTNVVKCRTPNNRSPDGLEIATCSGLWLEAQLQLLRPKIILALGNTATQQLLGTSRGITQLRGQWFAYQHASVQGGAYECLLMPLLHPAYLLRNPVRTPGGPKSLTWRDIQEVAAVLRGERTPASVRGRPGQVPGGLFSAP